MGLTRVSAAVAVAALSAGAVAAAAQETVRSVRLLADLTAGDGSADVRVEYELDLGAAATSVPFEILGFGGATAERFELDDPRRSVSLVPVSGSRREAAVLVSADAPGGGVRVVARYRVEAAVAMDGAALRGHVPVLTVDWPPAQALPGLFGAELRVPAAWELSEGFPTGLAEAVRGGEGARTYVVDLAVAPSVVSFRGRTDGARRPGMPLTLDVLAALLIAGFGLVGWRHLRSVANGARPTTAEGGR